MIHNIHILTQPDCSPSHAAKLVAAHEQARIDAHRRGEHPWGSKRRDCPLCQLGK